MAAYTMKLIRSAEVDGELKEEQLAEYYLTYPYNPYDPKANKLEEYKALLLFLYDISVRLRWAFSQVADEKLVHKIYFDVLLRYLHKELKEHLEKEIEELRDSQLKKIVKS